MGTIYPKTTNPSWPFCLKWFFLRWVQAEEMGGIFVCTIHATPSHEYGVVQHNYVYWPGQQRSCAMLCACVWRSMFLSYMMVNSGYEVRTIFDGMSVAEDSSARSVQKSELVLWFIVFLWILYYKTVFQCEELLRKHYNITWIFRTVLSDCDRIKCDLCPQPQNDIKDY